MVRKTNNYEESASRDESMESISENNSQVFWTEAMQRAEEMDC
jgi:hypothetical protein